VKIVTDGIKWECTAGNIHDKIVEMSSLGQLPEVPPGLLEQIRSKVKVAGNQARAPS